MELGDVGESQEMQQIDTVAKTREERTKNERRSMVFSGFEYEREG